MLFFSYSSRRNCFIFRIGYILIFNIIYSIILLNLTIDDIIYDSFHLILYIIQPIGFILYCRLFKLIMIKKSCNSIYELSTDRRLIIPDNKSITGIIIALIIIFICTISHNYMLLTFLAPFCSALIFSSLIYFEINYKILYYTLKYAYLLYGNSEYNIISIIIQIISDYGLYNIYLRLPKKEVESESLEFIYSAVLSRIKTSDDSYYIDGTLSDCGQMLYMFLLNVINKQLQGNYISSTKYNIRKEELYALYKQ